MRDRLYLLDVTRGFASLSVVVWHYQHFFFIGNRLPSDFNPAELPFYAALFPLYEVGGRAVQLFFVLSGFVFFHRYEGSVRAWDFFTARFARLYPLHLATLIAVAAGQLIARSTLGQFIVYQCNDLPHFILNLALVAYWMPRDDICYSFNAPVWSVSVEVLLYLVFFFVAATAKSFGAKATMVVGLIIFGIAVHQSSPSSPVGYPLFSFFSGGFAYLIWSRSNGAVMSAAAALMLMAMSVPAFLLITADQALGLFAFPGLVLLLATVQNNAPNFGTSIRIVGDITYSTYLLHFPLQLLILLAVSNGFIAVDFRSPAAWLAFLGLVVALSVPTYYWFELPMKRAISLRFALRRESTIS